MAFPVVFPLYIFTTLLSLDDDRQKNKVIVVLRNGSQYFSYTDEWYIVRLDMQVS